MATLEVHNEQQGCFVLAGELNRHTVVKGWPERNKDFQQVAKNNQPIKIDLSGVSHIDTAGLAWLVDMIAEQKKQGLSISLLNCTDSLLKLAKISDVHSLLPLE